MSDENKFLYLRNRQNKISYDNLTGKLEKKDLAANNKLIQIFNFFDKDGNGVIETQNSNGVNEIQSLWSAIKTSANKNNNSIFETQEAEEMLETAIGSSGKTLAEEGISAADLFDFIKSLVDKKETSQTISLNTTIANQLTQEEVQDLSVQTLADDASNARKLFDAQNQNQGDISKFVNATKENFDTEYAASRVNRYLRKEELCVDLLQRSSSPEGLSQKEYLEAKIDFVISLIQDLEQYSLRTEITQDAINISLKTITFGILGDNKTKNSQETQAQKAELEHLKSLLAKLSPEEINVFISQLISIKENPETESSCNMSVGGKNNIAKPQKIKRGGVEKNQILSSSAQDFEAQASDGSLESLVSKNEVYKKMTFEEVFKAERGIEYNSEVVMDYAQKDSYMQFLLGIHNKKEQITEILKPAYFIKQTRAYGSEQVPGEIQHNARNLMFSLTTALKSVYGNDATKVEKFLDSIYPQSSNSQFSSLFANTRPKVVTNEKGEFVSLDFGIEGQNATFTSADGKTLNLPNMNLQIDDRTISTMLNIADKLQDNINEKYRSVLNGKTIEEYGSEVKEAYTRAYGNGDSQAMANAFIKSQQEGVGTVKGVVGGAGMLMMVAGQLIPVGGQVAAALIWGGIATSTLGSVGVSAVENYTKAGGPTEEDKKAMLQELVTSGLLVGSGMGIGKGSEAVFRILATKCPKLVAWAAEIGVDATASLLADYAITGQVDLSGEGIAQLQAVLVGLLKVKGNFKNYIDTHAGDASVNSTTKSNTPDDVSGTTRLQSNEVDLNRTRSNKPNTLANKSGNPVSQEISAETIMRTANSIKKSDIPEKYQSTWETCKSEIANIIKQIKDGTFKFDETIEQIATRLERNLSNIAENVSDKVKLEINKLITEFKDYIQTAKNKFDPANSYENKMRILEQIKSQDGNPKFSRETIDAYIKLNENVPTKTLYALLNLKDWWAANDEINDILKHIKTPEDIRTLDLLIETNKYSLGDNVTHKELSNNFNYFDIIGILENKTDDVSGFDVLLKKLLKDDITSLTNSLDVSITVTYLLTRVSNDTQKNALTLMVDKLKNNAPQHYIDRFDLHDITKMIDSPVKFKVLEKLLNSAKNKEELCQTMLTYSYQIGGVDDYKQKNYMFTVLSKLSDLEINAWGRDRILTRLAESKFEDINQALLLKMIDEKEPIDNIEFIASLAKKDGENNSALTQFIKETGKIPYDALELNKVQLDTDLEAQAFQAILNANEKGRFEALAVKDIIATVKTPEDLITLKSALQNKTLDAHTIIKMLNDKSDTRWMHESKIPDSPEGSSNATNSTPKQPKKISKKYQKKLKELELASPKRYNKLLESGLLELIEAGKVDASILKNIDSNTFLSNRTLNAIRKLRDGEPNIKTLTSEEELTNISHHVELGEVCEFNGKLYVNENGSATEIKLSKEKFEELFPPLSSVSFEQGRLGDCYFVTTLDNCMDLPMGKVALYKLFEQQGNDVSIKFPNMDKAIKFRGGKPVKVSNKQINGYRSENAPGIQMIEQAFAVHRLNDGERAYSENTPITDIAKLSNVKKLMDRLEGGWQYEVIKDVFGEDITCNRYGTDLENREVMKDLIATFANDPETLVFFATRDTPKGDRTMLSSEYDLAGQHGYSIKGYDETTGMVYITNPWHTSVVTEVPLYELMKYINDVNIAKFDLK